MIMFCMSVYRRARESTHVHTWQKGCIVSQYSMYMEHWLIQPSCVNWCSWKWSTVNLIGSPLPKAHDFLF